MAKQDKIAVHVPLRRRHSGYPYPPLACENGSEITSHSMKLHIQVRKPNCCVDRHCNGDLTGYRKAENAGELLGGGFTTLIGALTQARSQPSVQRFMHGIAGVIREVRRAYPP